MLTATIDVRISQMKQIQDIQKEIEKICAMTYVEGTKTKLMGEIDRMPIEKTDRVKSIAKG